MDFGKLTLFQAMQIKMGYLSERQDVLSQNIANIDTPGYKPKDLKKLDFKRMAMLHANRLKMRVTSENHSSGTVDTNTHFREEKQRKTFETTPVENAVVLEEQMAKVAETQMQFQEVTNLYKKTTSMFKTAIGTRN